MGRRRYTEQQFREAVADPTITTIADLCRRLGIVPRGSNYETVRRYARQLELEDPLFTRTRDRWATRWRADVSDPSAVAAAIASSRTVAEAIRRLGGDVKTHTRRRLRAVIEEHQIDTSHMLGQGWARGRRFPQNRVPVAEMFEREHVTSSEMRKKLIAEGYKDHRCEGCGHTQWEGQPIPLELDHIDGDRTNNRLENLRLLCPNCHALTPTYRGRNIGRH